MRILIITPLLLCAVFQVGFYPSVLVAQDIDTRRFSPLESGNSWEYRIRPLQGTPGPGPSFIRYHVDARDTVINAESYSILSINGYDDNLKETFVRRCAFRRTTNHYTETIPLDDDFRSCEPYIVFTVSPLISMTGPARVSVGASRFSAESTAFFGESNIGTGGYMSSTIQNAALDFGVYYYKRETIGQQNPPVGTNNIWEAALIFAEVNEVKYGSTVVSTEDPVFAINQGVARISMLFPNPFRGSFRFEVEGLQAGEATLILYNMAGESVLSEKVLIGNGTIPVRFEGQASGIYMLRVIDQNGSLAQALLTHISSHGGTR